jgi:SAM-dependent methyltransferase
MDIKEYWDKKIIEWEDSMRGGSDVSFIERLASYFREHLYYRSALAMEMLIPFVKGKTVLDLGCGSGFFSFELYDRARPKHISGIDISLRAISRAQAIAEEKGLSDIFSFFEADAASISLPEADYTIGLGFLDYLTLREIHSLFERIRSRYFLFSFAEKKMVLFRYIHILYMLLQRCPKHFYNTKKEIRQSIGGKYDNVQFLNDKKMRITCIVHNLPIGKFS